MQACLQALAGVGADGAAPRWSCRQTTLRR